LGGGRRREQQTGSRLLNAFAAVRSGSSVPRFGIGCDQLSTSETFPSWIVDAQYHKPDAYYVPIDTQIDCDGLTLFDSPTLQTWDVTEDQIFGGLDYVILHGVVIATVRWIYEKKYKADPQYTVSITGPPLLPTLQAMQKLTFDQGFNVVFTGPTK
jgi:hypothetical protein